MAIRARAEATASVFPDEIASFMSEGVTKPLSHAPTVRGALALASQWLFLHSPAVMLTVEESDNKAAILFDLVLDPPPRSRQTIDLCLATRHRIFATAIGNSYQPISVWLPHTPLVPLSRYIQFFAATVHPNSRRAKLVVPVWLLDAPIPGADDDVHANALAFIRSKHPQPDDSLAVKVRYEITRSLGTEDAEYGAVARALRLHPRTMQRHLNRESTSFAQIKDEVLRNTAYRYLTESTMTVSQLAQILGFSELSAFSRACRKWFGASPTVVRSHINLR